MRSADSPRLEEFLVREGFVLATRTKDGRRKFWEIIDAAPVSFYTSVRGITGSRLTAKDATGSSTTSLDTHQQSVLKQLRPVKNHVLQLLVGFDAEPHPGAQRIFFETPLGTTVYGLDEGNPDAKNIGFIDGRVSSIEAPQPVFSMWVTDTLPWALKFVNNYPLQVDPNVWFLGMLVVPELLGMEWRRGSPTITANGEKPAQNNPEVKRPDRFLPVPIGRVEQVPSHEGAFSLGGGRR